MSVTALRELRRVLPTANITLVSKPGTADIFQDADFIDEVLVYDRSGLASKWNQIREWQQRKFDLAILFQNAFEAAAIAFLARVPIRIGYGTERRSALAFVLQPGAGSSARGAAACPVFLGVFAVFPIS